MSISNRLDLHVHSAYSSDSRLSLETVVDLLGPRGLQGFALTDHNSIAGHRRLRELARDFPRYLMIPGVEVSSADGHLLVLGVDELPPKGRSLPETLDWVHAHGGLSVLAHPFRLVHGAGNRWARSAPAEGIETMNGHSSAVANARAELIAARRRLGATGGSDAHLLPDLGRAVTEFPDGIASVDEVLEQIRTGRTQASGRSSTPGERLRLGLRSALLRARRGLRPI